MKKLVALLVVMGLAACAFAANDIEIKAEDAGSGVLRILYNVDAASETDPVGISMNVSLSDGATAAPADVSNVDPCFPVYIDYVNSIIPDPFDPETWTGYAIGDGHPMATTDAAGVPAGAVSAFSLCLGNLEEAAPAKGVDHVLCEIQLTQGTAAYSDVTISADTKRGEVVGSTFTVTYPAVTRVNFVVEGCIPSGHADFADWDALGQPQSWCNVRQCYGDANGAQGGDPKTGYYWVGSDDLNLLIAGWKDQTYVDEATDPWIAADFNRRQGGDPKTGYYRVGSDDLNILIANWKDDTNVSDDCNQ